MLTTCRAMDRFLSLFYDTPMLWKRPLTRPCNLYMSRLQVSSLGGQNQENLENALVKYLSRGMDADCLLRCRGDNLLVLTTCRAMDRFLSLIYDTPMLWKRPLTHPCSLYMSRLQVSSLGGQNQENLENALVKYLSRGMDADCLLRCRGDNLLVLTTCRAMDRFLSLIYDTPMLWKRPLTRPCNLHMSVLRQASSLGGQNQENLENALVKYLSRGMDADCLLRCRGDNLLVLTTCRAMDRFSSLFYDTPMLWKRPLTRPCNLYMSRLQVSSLGGQNQENLENALVKYLSRGTGADCLLRCRGHNLPVWDIAACPAGHYFASASNDRTVRVWCTDRVHAVRILTGAL